MPQSLRHSLAGVEGSVSCLKWWEERRTTQPNQRHLPQVFLADAAWMPLHDDDDDDDDHDDDDDSQAGKHQEERETSVKT